VGFLLSGSWFYWVAVCFAKVLVVYRSIGVCFWLINKQIWAFFVTKGTFLKLIEKELALKILMRIIRTH